MTDSIQATSPYLNRPCRELSEVYPDMASPPKTPGQIAYETELRAKPLYHDGTARKTWNRLDNLSRRSWERNPTPRWTMKAKRGQ